MKKLIYILALAALFSACSEYHKAVKSTDSSEKFKMGTEMYDQGKYSKANRLFVQIVPKYRGKPQAQRLMYMYADSFYQMKDYYTANYQFERFVSAYPESEKVEEAAFLGAKSYYFLSPIYSKDQKETIDAIDKLQAFINSFPDSEYSEEANTLVKELDYKLEQKAYEIAYQYNKTVAYTRDYQAAISAFDNFLLDYPGSSFREKALFYKFDSAYKLAINSIESRMEERLKSAMNHYNSFKKVYPESEFGQQADDMSTQISELLENYKSKS